MVDRAILGRETPQLGETIRRRADGLADAAVVLGQRTQQDFRAFAQVSIGTPGRQPVRELRQLIDVDAERDAIVALALRGVIVKRVFLPTMGDAVGETGETEVFEILVHHVADA